MIARSHLLRRSGCASIRLTSDGKFTVEEGAALLHAIFPNYPSLEGSNATPQVEEFLRTSRAATLGPTDAECSNAKCAEV